MRLSWPRPVLPLVAALAAVPPAAAQANKWAPARCDIKPGHFLVNSGLLYLKSATETRFEDQKTKDLQAANTVLTQALTTGEQTKNPAAWYYYGRYYLMIKDLPGADTAFTHAETLQPDCKTDIATWRRGAWVEIVNAGIAAWQGNNTDSAIKAFRRANAIWRGEPTAFKYLASLLYQAGQPDSAAFYFRRTAEIAATDTSKAQDRKDALYNLARIEHSQRHWAEAQAAYTEYLTLAPKDPEVLASLGSVLLQRGQRDSAFTIYKAIIANADSTASIALFRAGVEIYQGVGEEPDTASVGRACRGTARPVPPARIRACRDSTGAIMRQFNTEANATYRLAAQAFEAGVKVNPYFRDGLFNLVNTYLVLNDSASMLAPARRLYGVDPLNRQSIRLLAFAHQRLGQLDSTLTYLRLADSTLIADVTITQFAPEEQNAEVKGTVTNLRRAPSPAFKVVFEFLTAKGDVVSTQALDVPALQGEQVHPFELKGTGAGILAWRYRRQ